MQPIPRKLLIHAATFIPGEKPAGWGNESPAGSVPLKHIRLEPYTQYVRTKDNAEVKTSTLLIYDTRNSEPKGLDFTGTEGRIITIAGVDHTIANPQPIYDEHRLHHWEIGLI